ncbi:MAG: hypothetical protein LBH91_05125 [Prevotellaceae bacterium]|nr:hypothetical protein [Prevotellaceae bacterium]
MRLIVRNFLFLIIFLTGLFTNKLSAQLVTSGTVTNVFDIDYRFQTTILTNVSNVTAPNFVGVTALPYDFIVTLEPNSTAKTLTIQAANDCYNADNKIFKL